ncbi:hypothetical protein [Geofilum rubicundum]|uniref:Uncharacterized protein n=1 Tax=Geofilum rubicundum JCM 15548 TaxID=1236989 RepID=A0A0E9LWQ9_9BACT|nr:hypothetical protein [Geofilum rubicundum]GAO29743.1 hypothetical protein JCM15548_11964 [Geofilum rubicundum JCM 15548]
MVTPCLSTTAEGQSVSFELKTSPNVAFEFTTVNQYLAGVTRVNAIQLNIETTDQWDLYVGTTSDLPGFWDEVSLYSLNGDRPPVSILQLRARNGSNTSQVSNFVPLRDLSDPVYLIGSAATDALVACPNTGANAPGSFVLNPNCYRFDVDLRIVPGLEYRAGLYELRIDYVIVQDL